VALAVKVPEWTPVTLAAEVPLRHQQACRRPLTAENERRTLNARQRREEIERAAF